MLLFSCSAMSDSLRPHVLQHTRLPCLSLCPGVCLNSCLLNLWCHSTVSFSAIPYSSFPQSVPASGLTSMSWLFASASQSIGASASASILPMNIQDWFPLGLTGLISLLSKGLSGVFSAPQIQKHWLALSLPYGPTLTSIHDYWKNHSFDCMDLCQQSECVFFLIHCLGLS